MSAVEFKEVASFKELNCAHGKRITYKHQNSEMTVCFFFSIYCMRLIGIMIQEKLTKVIMSRMA